jgi:hypothetical protein
MADFNVRSDAVNVEQIMEQIRARIREKRGVDYTEAQVRELASVKLEKFLDPRGVRSDLLEQYRKAQPPYAPPELPNFSFEADTLFTSTRGPLRFIRRLLLPILKLFFNPNPLIQALNIQSRLNATAAEREAKRDAQRYAFDQLHYEVMHNLVVETTRLGIEVKNLKMRLESLASRLEFSERRARALESVVAYKPAGDEARRDEGRRDETRRDESRRDETRREDGRRQEGRREERRPETRRPEPPAPPPPAAIQPEAAAAAPESTGESATDAAAAGAGGAAGAAEGPGQRSRRRRRRRGRRGGGAAAAAVALGQGGSEASAEAGASDLPIEAGDENDGDDDGIDEVGGNTSAPSSDVDARVARPEPIEHAFGAQAHPAEHEVNGAAQSAPAPEPAAAPRSGHEPPTETTPQGDLDSDPSTAPEQ